MRGWRFPFSTLRKKAGSTRPRGVRDMDDSIASAETADSAEDPARNGITARAEGATLREFKRGHSMWASTFELLHLNIKPYRER